MPVCGISNFKVLFIFSKKMLKLLEQNSEHTCLWLTLEENFQICILEVFTWLFRIRFTFSQLHKLLAKKKCRKVAIRPLILKSTSILP